MALFKPGVGEARPGAAGVPRLIDRIPKHGKRPSLGRVKQHAADGLSSEDAGLQMPATCGVIGPIESAGGGRQEDAVCTHGDMIKVDTFGRKLCAGPCAAPIEGKEESAGCVGDRHRSRAVAVYRR